MDLKSDDAEYKVSSMEGEEVEKRQQSPGSPSSQNSFSPDFSASSCEDEDGGQNVAGQQPQSTQWTLLLYHRRLLENTFTAGARRKSKESGRSFGQSTPLSVLSVFFAGIVTLLVVGTNNYFQGYMSFFHYGLTLQLEVNEVEMFVLLTLALQEGHIFRARLENYWTKQEQVRCPFCGQTTVDQNMNTYSVSTLQGQQFIGRMKDMTMENTRLV
jgi:hypothetical protein